MDLDITDEEARIFELDRLAAEEASTEHPLIQRANAVYDVLSDEEKLAQIQENLKLTPSERIERNIRRVKELFAEAGEPIPPMLIRAHLTDP